MVLVDYIGVFFYISQYFWQMTVSLWFPSILLKKKTKTTIIIDGPSSLFIWSDLFRSELSVGRVVWYLASLSIARFWQNTCLLLLLFFSTCWSRGTALQVGKKAVGRQRNLGLPVQKLDSILEWLGMALFCMHLVLLSVSCYIWSLLYFIILCSDIF